MKKYNSMAWLDGKVKVAWCFAIDGIVIDFAGWASHKTAQQAADAVFAGKPLYTSAAAPLFFKEGICHDEK